MTTISDFSVMLFPWGAEPPNAHDVVAATVLAEELGFYSATLPTHMTMPPVWLFETFPNQDVLDALAVVPAMAVKTERIKIGFNSVVLPTLPPYEWAKYLSTLDVMSDGRLIAGAAMGWWEEDFSSVGVNQRRRGKLFDEQLEAIKLLMTEERATFEGEFYQFKDMPMWPKPVQKPYPPIWIGGGPKSIDRTAKYGECILSFWPDEDIARDFWVPELAKAGEKYGTDPKLAGFTFVYVADSESDRQKYQPVLEKAIGFDREGVDANSVAFVGSPEHCAERIQALRAAGLWHIVLEFQFHGLESVAFGMRQMEKFATEVIPLLD